MSEEFKAIETQEAFDNAIKARLERNTRTVTEEVTKKFEGYIPPDEQAKLTKRIDELTSQLTQKDSTIADLTAKNKEYEIASVKARIAREAGLPAELADRLTGTNEQEYKADAEALAKFVTKENPPAPMFSGENSGKSTGTNAALMDVLNVMSNGG